MKTVLGFLVGIVGISALSGCGAPGSGASGEAVAEESAPLLVTASALARGTRHDYDGDGKEDLLVVDGDGSRFLLGMNPAGFGQNVGTWYRSDLTYSNAQYTIGDFNHDGKSDLLITTVNGTFEQTGTSGGNLNTNVWSTTAFKKNSGGSLVDFVVGDFNGDGWGDFIATTSTGSYLYTGKGSGGASGGFNANVWSSTATAFKRGNVTLTAGNFNNDNTTDFIATTATGSYLYTGKTTGGFNANVWTTTAITNPARFAVADYNGVSPDDFIVQTASGASLYLGNPNGSFTANYWTEPSYGITGSRIVPGLFNGDGNADFIIQDGQALIVRPFIGLNFTGWNDYSDVRYKDFYNSSVIRGDYNGDGFDDFLVQTRSNTGNGTSETTASWSYTTDAWLDPDLFQGSAN